MPEAVASPTPSPDGLTVDEGISQLLEIPEEITETDPQEPEEESTEDDPEEEGEATEDESDEDDEPEDDEEAPQTYTVKVDGKEEAVTLDEALKGYSRTADYTRKTQALADERKSFEAEIVEGRAVRARYAEALDKAAALFGDEEPDWDQVQKEHPDQYPTLFANYQRKQDAKQKLLTERETIRQAEMAENAKLKDLRIAEQAVKMEAAIPEFRDSATRADFVKSLFEYGATEGFESHELANIDDHRAIVILNKARKWDALQARKVTTTKKAEAVPTMKPGAKPPTSKGKNRKAHETARAKLSESGRVDDAIEALMNID